MKYLASILLALVIVLLAAGIVSKAVMPDGTAVATRVEGTAVIFTSDAPAGRPVRKDDTVAKGDRVEVPGGSRLELRLPDGGFVRASENTRLEVRMLQYEKRTGYLYLQAMLAGGRVWVRTSRRGAAGSHADVITGAGLVVGGAAVYSVDAEGGAGMTVSVYEGTAHAVSSAGSGSRTAGQPVAPAEAAAISIGALQRSSLPDRQTAPQPLAFDLKAAMNDWVRWNLQRDAREGLASITVAPASPTITLGASLQFAAAAHYADNVEKDITSFATWSTSNAAVAKVDPFGSAAGTAPGTADIAAAIEDVKGAAVLNVSREIVSIRVAPASGSIVNGGVQQFTATGTFSDRTVRDITGSAVWRSSNSNVAVVDAAGRAVGGNTAGTAVISASLGSKRASATLRVRRELVSIAILPVSAVIIPGDTQKFGAIGTYSDKTTQDLTELAEWETSNLRIAVMDQVQAGLVLGQNAGTATITATFKNISGSATITVEKISSR